MIMVPESSIIDLSISNVQSRHTNQQPNASVWWTGVVDLRRVRTASYIITKNYSRRAPHRAVLINKVVLTTCMACVYVQIFAVGCLTDFTMVKAGSSFPPRRCQTWTAPTKNGLSSVWQRPLQCVATAMHVRLLFREQRRRELLLSSKCCCCSSITTRRRPGTTPSK